LQTVLRREKERVKECLRSRNWEEIEASVARDPRLLGLLIWALYQADEELAWRAAEGFGRAVAVLVGDKEEFCKDKMRRLYWALNDESGISGRFVAPAIAEAVARSPEVFGENALIIMNVLDEPYLQAGAAWAFGRVGGVRPELVAEISPRLRRLLQSPDPEVRGNAAWALGEMMATEAAQELEALASDEGRLNIFTNGILHQTTVGELVRAAREKLRRDGGRLA